MPSQTLLDVQNLLNRTNLYRFMRKMILGSSTKPEDRPFDQVPGIRRVPLREFSSNLSDILDTLNRLNIVPLLVVPPEPSPEGYFGGQKMNLHILHEAYQKEIRELAVGTNTLLVDLQPVFDQYKNLFPVDPIHYNSKGNNLAATAIFETLTQLLEDSAQ